MEPIQYYSVNEAAHMLGISTATIRRMMEAGELPRAAKLGKRLIFPKSGFDSWLLQRGLIER